MRALLALALLVLARPAGAQNVTNPAPPAARPTAPPAQVVAPHAGAAGDAEAGATAAPTGGLRAAGSDNGGQLAGASVPGGRNRAPNEGPTPGSFSKPIDK